MSVLLAVLLLGTVVQAEVMPLAVEGLESNKALQPERGLERLMNRAVALRSIGFPVNLSECRGHYLWAGLDVFAMPLSTGGQERGTRLGFVDESGQWALMARMANRLPGESFFEARYTMLVPWQTELAWRKRILRTTGLGKLKRLCSDWKQ